MDQAMRLIGRYASPYVRRVAVTMQLYGLPYEHLGIMPFGDDRARLRRFNPVARVPVLELDGGECLIDSAAILDYLDERVGPSRALTPARGPVRRRVLTLLAVALGANEKLVAVLYERHFRPEEKWHRPWLDACERQLSDGYRWLDDRLRGECFAGGQMSQADVTVAVFWSFGRSKRPGLFARLGCPRLAALAARLEALPAFATTVPEPEVLSEDLGEPADR